MVHVDFIGSPLQDINVKNIIFVLDLDRFKVQTHYTKFEGFLYIISQNKDKVRFYLLAFAFTWYSAVFEPPDCPHCPTRGKVK